jgi:hypothetical protein
MELELKAADEGIPTRLKIYEQAMARKRDKVLQHTSEIKSINNELEGMKQATEKAMEKSKKVKKRKSDEA